MQTSGVVSRFSVKQLVCKDDEVRRLLEWKRLYPFLVSQHSLAQVSSSSICMVLTRFTMISADSQSRQMRERNTRKILSHLCSLGRLTVLCLTANCRLRARFSAIRIDRFTKRFRTRTQTAFKMDIYLIYPHQNMVEINLDYLIVSSC